MKTIKKSIFAVILYSLMAFPGCQVVGIDSIEDNPSAGGKTVTITANIAGSTDTKVSLTPDTDAEGHPIVKVDWKESGEKFYVLGKTIEEFTQVSGNVFEGVLPEPDGYGEYTALYCSEEFLTTGDCVEAYSEQDGTLDEKYVLMMAVFDAQSELITFDHATSIFKLAFKFNGEPLTNITSVTVGDKPRTHEISITPPEGKEALNDDIYMHVACTTNVVDNHQMMFKVMAGDKEYEASLTIPSDVDLEFGKLYTATINLEEKYNGGSVDGDLEGGVVNLSENGTANSYIISAAGSYKFSTVKGNSSESVGAVASAEVLWESFGTNVTPNVGDLVKNISYKNGEVTFQTADTFKEGNAVIAAKDASGNILWSWHIWLTDQPEGQVYYNNAGTMMDRNLGATSATPGDVGALGLLYQWGRKDPFLGSSSISSSIEAKSTIIWPSAVPSVSSSGENTIVNGTIDYATAHPTTFITYNNNNKDWYYTGSFSTDNTRWATSSSRKSIYDPCPAGWRVPDGGDEGVWSKALGSSAYFAEVSLYNNTSKGMNFSGKFGSASTIWYPASGYRPNDDGVLDNVGNDGECWSASPRTGNGTNGAFYLYFRNIGNVYPANYGYRAYGSSVRCLQIIDEVAEL